MTPLQKQALDALAKAPVPHDQFLAQYGQHLLEGLVLTGRAVIVDGKVKVA